MKILVVAIFMAAVLIGTVNWPSFGVVYATDGMTIRRIILPDHNAQLYEAMPLSADERMLIVQHIPFGDARRCSKQIDISACRRLVEAAQ